MFESTRSAPMLSTISPADVTTRRVDRSCPRRGTHAPAAPQSTPRLALSMPPGSSPRRTASATLKRWLRIAASASSGRPAMTASTIAVCSSTRGRRAPGDQDRAVLVAHGLGAAVRGSAAAPFRAPRARAASRAGRRSRPRRRAGRRPRAARRAARGTPAHGLRPPRRSARRSAEPQALRARRAPGGSRPLPRPTPCARVLPGAARGPRARPARAGSAPSAPRRATCRRWR